MLCDKQGKDHKANKRFRAEYYNGIEIIKGEKLDHVDSDRWFPNLVLCFLTVACIVVGIVVDIKVAYCAMAFYFIQFCDYYCSLTKIIIPNVDPEQRVANLLNEYYA